MATSGERRQARRQGQQEKKNYPWLWTLPLFAIGIVAVAVLGLTHKSGSAPSAPKGIGDAVPAAVLKAVTEVPQGTLNAVEPSGAVVPLAVPPTDKPTAKPVFLYMGAEYCPYCAAQRWPLIIALSRFGKFEGLKLSASSSTDAFPNTPTFTFAGSTYTSDYIELQAVETQGRAVTNGSYPLLQTPDPGQQALFRKYDGPPYTQSAGSIPFMLIGQSYLWVGSSVPPGVLQGKTWQDVASSLTNPSEEPAKTILTNVAMMTAGICRMDGGQPGEVCNDAAVQAASKLLPALRAS